MCHDSHWACTLDSVLQMRDDDSVSLISTFLATFSVPLKRRLTLPAWLAVSAVRRVSLFTPVTATGYCRSPAISSLQVSPTVATSCITSRPRRAMPAFPDTQAMLKFQTKGAFLVIQKEQHWQPHTVLNLHHPHWPHSLLVSLVASCF